MAAARKYPDVAFQVGEKLNVDAVPVPRHVVAEGRHGVVGVQLGADVAQRVARARGHDAEVGGRYAPRGAKMPALSGARNLQNAGFLDLRARPRRAVEQQAVEI